MAAEAVGLVCAVSALTPRLRFVLSTIFEQWLRIPVVVTTEPVRYQRVHLACGIRVPRALELPLHPLLQGRGTAFYLSKWDEAGFFPLKDADYSHDLLAMAFYVLSLYPLYEWPYGYDEWGLYAWDRAPFYEAPFWAQPFLQEHVYRLLDAIGFSFQRPGFTWEVGWDIDHPYAWRGRWGLRWWAGGIRRRNLSQRLLAQLGRVHDPYDTLAEIQATFRPQHSRFFFLMSSRHRLDSLVSPQHPVWKQLAGQLLRQGYSVGLHPSYCAREKPAFIRREKTRLERLLNRPVTCSRQHYLRYFWPDTFYHLAAAGIQADYSLAFPARSGFLLGVALPTALYDAKRERPLPLNFWPPALMDQVYLRTGDIEGLAHEIQRLYTLLRQTGGHLHLIWHNSTWEAAEPLRALANAC